MKTERLKLSYLRIKRKLKISTQKRIVRFRRLTRMAALWRIPFVRQNGPEKRGVGSAESEKPTCSAAGIDEMYIVWLVFNPIENCDDL